MLNQQTYLTTGDDEMLLDDTTPITFGENKKSNCKVIKHDLPNQYSNGMINFLRFFGHTKTIDFFR
jgi:hypothetical protein